MTKTQLTTAILAPTLITVLIIVFIAIPNVTAEQADLNCDDLEPYAGGVMLARQDGASLRDLMEGVDFETLVAKGGDIDVWREVIKQAYAQPRFTSWEDQKFAIEEFQNQVYLDCLKAQK